jgi:hypothetical protein
LQQGHVVFDKRVDLRNMQFMRSLKQISIAAPLDAWT